MTFKGKIIISALAFAFVAIFSWQELKLQTSARAVFCDVGQGDGAVINIRNTQIIIDGGPDKKILSCLGKYLPYFDRKIEYLIISHPDKDHFLGAVEILKRYDVGSVILNGESGDSQEYEELLRLAAGKIAAAENFEAAAVKIIFYKIDDKKSTDNDKSLVFKFIYNGTGILFTGDISQKIESVILADDLKSDILKIAHHGSKESSSQEFLKAVNPKLAVLSVGADNKYGHPAYIILKRLENLGIKYLRTDEAGDLIINFQ